MDAITHLKKVIPILAPAVCLTVSISYGQEDSPAGGKSRPNIIFVFADDWGWGDLGCYGHQQLRTPNLDRLASQGTLFTQFYVCSGVCSPSRTAVMTGHFPAAHRIHGHLATHELNEKRAMPDWLDEDATTLTDLLRQAGYRAGHFGKWHLGSGEGAPPPGAYGIDEHRVWNGGGPTWPTDDPKWRARSTEKIIDESIAFMEKHRGAPFYINAWLLDTHARLTPTQDQLDRYPRDLGAIQMYYAAATEADHQIGRLLARLDELGLSENTIVVFSSDNGPEDIEIRNASEHGVGSAGPFRGRKRSLYEGGVRVPFIVRWPGETPAGRVDHDSVISAVDLLPTFCRLAGAKVPRELDLDGEDMSSALHGKNVTRTKPLMWEWRFRIYGHVLNHSPQLSIRDGKWKLLMNPDRSRVELYDIPSDPSEMNNLAKEHPDVVNQLAERVLAWQKTLPPGPVEEAAGSNAYPWPGSK